MSRAGQVGPGPLWDEGLQPERTTLSWLRTALGFVGVNLLVLRLAMPLGPLAWSPALVTLLAAVPVIMAAYRRHRRGYAALMAGRRTAALGPIAGLTVLVLACCVLATFLVLTTQ